MDSIKFTIQNMDINAIKGNMQSMVQEFGFAFPPNSDEIGSKFGCEWFVPNVDDNEIQEQLV